jgi:hypothetical protein
MWGNDGRGSPLPFTFGGAGQAGRRAPDEWPGQPDNVAEGAGGTDARANLPDIESMEGSENASNNAGNAPVGPQGGVTDVDSSSWRRMRARNLIREFLRSTPRTEAEEEFTFHRPDGAARTVTRADLSAAVDRMRPRMRRIIRLAVEEHWSRKRVCEHLGISIKTYERDHVEALDALVEM